MQQALRDRVALSLEARKNCLSIDEWQSALTRHHAVINGRYRVRILAGQSTLPGSALGGIALS